jgi:hypothetical protein
MSSVIPFTRLRRPPGRYVVYGLLLVALLGQIPLLQRAVRMVRESPPSDPVAIAEHRLAGIRSALGGVQRAGYVTDIPGDSIGTDAAATERYFLTQYVLAPVVLERGTMEELVVGNFAADTLPGCYTHLRVIGRYDRGLLLLRGEPR